MALLYQKCHSKDKENQQWGKVHIVSDIIFEGKVKLPFTCKRSWYFKGN